MLGGRCDRAWHRAFAPETHRRPDGRDSRAPPSCRKSFLPTSRAYDNHCAKAAWTTALVSLQRAGCGHVDALGVRSMPVASAAEIASGQKQVRRASNILA